MNEERTGTPDVWACPHCGTEYRGSGGITPACTVCGAARHRRKLQIDMVAPWQPVESDFLEQVAMQVTEELADRSEYHLFMDAIYARGHWPEWRVVPSYRTEETVGFTFEIRDGGPTVGE